MTAVIRTENLTKYYGSHRGIVDVNLEVEKGEVFGFLGPNGAGKTTTIRVLLDLIRPTKGKAFVFEFSLYDRLTGAQTLEYFGNLRGGVDPAYQKQLIERFDLDPTRRFREYSKGNKQKVGLVAALQHQPELLLLDEPTSGLDPLVQQTFFTIMRAQVKDGATVFLSSHILSEVERSCDRVAIIREGQLVRADRVDALKDMAHHQVEMRFAGNPPADEFKKLPGVSDVEVNDHSLRLTVQGLITPVVQAAGRLGVVDFLSREPTLEETFLAQYELGAEAKR